MRSSDSDLAWAAGFIDAEGSFSIREQAAPRDVHSISTIVRISISQAEPRTKILFKLQELFGGRIYNHHRLNPLKPHNSALRWALSGREAFNFCQILHPYLILKKRHAELIIEHSLTKSSYSPEIIKGHCGRPRLTPEIVELRKAQIEEIQGLNTRGVWNRKTKFYENDSETPPPPLTEHQWGWLGGFIDGDGCISVNSVKMGKAGFRGETRGTVSHISIVQSEPRTWVLHWLHDVLGGYLCEIKHDLKNPKHSRAVSLTFSGEAAIKLSEQLLPYLRIKRRNAEIIIEHQSLKKTTVGTQKGSNRTDVRITEEIMAARQAHVDECALLNKRGTKND